MLKGLLIQKNTVVVTKMQYSTILRYRNESVYCAIRNSSYFSFATAPGITGKLSQNIVSSFSNEQIRELIPSLFCPHNRNCWWGLHVAGERHISAIEASEMIIYTQYLLLKIHQVEERLIVRKGKAELVKVSFNVAVIFQSLVYQILSILKFLEIQLYVWFHMSLFIAHVYFLLIVAWYNDKLGFHLGFSTARLLLSLLVGLNSLHSSGVIYNMVLYAWQRSKRIICGVMTPPLQAVKVAPVLYPH